MAMNIISKEKKEIKWIGLPTNSAQECQNLEVSEQNLFIDSSLLYFTRHFNLEIHIILKYF